MGLFQVEGSMNVGIKTYVCIGAGQGMLGIHYLMLTNSNTYMKERERHKARKADYVQIGTGHGMEQRGTVVSGAGMGEKLKPCGGRGSRRKLMRLQGKCQEMGVERPQLSFN